MTIACIAPVKCDYLSSLLTYLHEKKIETEISAKNPPCGDDVPKECKYAKIIAYMKNGKESQEIENYSREEIEVEQDVQGIDIYKALDTCIQSEIHNNNVLKLYIHTNFISLYELHT